jgi:hypothetical protein
LYFEVSTIHTTMTMNMKKRRWRIATGLAAAVALLVAPLATTNAFATTTTNVPISATTTTTNNFEVNAVDTAPVVPPTSISTHQDAWDIIDAFAAQTVVGDSTTTTDDDLLLLLYPAVQFLETHPINNCPECNQALWTKCQGSWQLLVSTGSADSHRFHTPPKFLPPFQFAMIDDVHFGNGIGWGPPQPIILLAFLQTHQWDPATQNLQVAIQDVYLLGKKIYRLSSSWLGGGGDWLRVEQQGAPKKKLTATTADVSHFGCVRPRLVGQGQSIGRNCLVETTAIRHAAIGISLWYHH